MSGSPADLLVFTRKQVHEMIQECASNQSHGGFMAMRALGDARLLSDDVLSGDDNRPLYVFESTVAWRDIHAEVDF